MGEGEQAEALSHDAGTRREEGGITSVKEEGMKRIEITQEYKVVDGVKEENKIYITLYSKNILGSGERVNSMLIIHNDEAKELSQKLNEIVNNLQ